MVGIKTGLLLSNSQTPPSPRCLCGQRQLCAGHARYAAPGSGLDRLERRYQSAHEGSSGRTGSVRNTRECRCTWVTRDGDTQLKSRTPPARCDRRRAHPMGWVGYPEEVAGAVFLCSADAGFVSGACWQSMEAWRQPWPVHLPRFAAGRLSQWRPTSGPGPISSDASPKTCDFHWRPSEVPSWHGTGPMSWRSCPAGYRGAWCSSSRSVRLASSFGCGGGRSALTMDSAISPSPTRTSLVMPSTAPNLEAPAPRLAFRARSRRAQFQSFLIFANVFPCIENTHIRS